MNQGQMKQKFEQKDLPQQQKLIAIQRNLKAIFAIVMLLLITISKTTIVQAQTGETSRSEQNTVSFLDNEEITPETWKTLHLVMLKADGSLVRVDLLRPLWWLQEYNAKVDGTIELSLPEIGIQGMATVLSIEDCQADSRKTKPGFRTVIGKITHENAVVLDLYFNHNSQEPLGVTPNHPIWSLDRNGWVEAGKLRIGEYVKTKDGETAQLTARQERPGRHTVYNLEVHKDHTFYVSNLKILVHNSYITTPGGRAISDHAILDSLKRHGFNDLSELDDIIDNASRIRTQADGATVFIKNTATRGREYSIVIFGDKGVVTAMKNLTADDLNHLGRRYGFNPNAY